MKPVVYKRALFSVALIFIGYSVAASASIYQPAHISWGFIEVTPEILAQIKYDDNFYKSSNSKATGVYVINPVIDFRAKSGLNEYSVSIDVTGRRYSQLPEKNSTDYQLKADVHHEFNSRHRLDVKAGLGTLFHEGQEVASTLELPKYKHQLLNVTYGFGSMKTPARMDFFGSTDQRDYVDEGFNSRSINEYGAIFHYRLLPRMDLLLEASRRDLNYYDIDDAGYSITNYFAGIDWEMTGKTSGFMKMGERVRDAQYPGAPSESFVGWEVGINYLIRSYSKLRFSAAQDYNIDPDQPQESNFSKGQQYRVSWLHDWNSRLSTRINFHFDHEDMMDRAGNKEKNKLSYIYQIGIDWSIRRWLMLSLDWQYTLRDEEATQVNVAETNYKRNVIWLSSKISI